jgi:hypothetical protein
MKKFFALLLAGLLCLSMVACGEQETESETNGNNTNETIEESETETEADLSSMTSGQALLHIFKTNLKNDPDMTLEEIANAMVSAEVMPAELSLMAMPVEEGFLMGFNEEIHGFEEAYVVAPMIGTIPFMSYVFQLADGADVNAFMADLEAKSNMRWNLCTFAEETVVGNVDNTVYFVMCKSNVNAAE